MAGQEENESVVIKNHIKFSLREIVADFDQIYQEDQVGLGLKTGLSAFDALSGGLHPANLIIIAGRPGMGKTALTRNIVEQVAIQAHKPVLFFSLETKAKSLSLKLISSLGRIDSHRIFAGQLEDEDWPKVTFAVQTLSEAPIYIENILGSTIDELCTKAHEMATSIGSLGLIVVDYIQLLCASENQAAELATITRRLKLLSKELDLPIIAVSQLNQDLEQRSDKRPLIGDLRDSSSIAEDADMLCFLYRDEYYNENSEAKGTAEIHLAKHRNGPQGVVNVAYLSQYGRFEDL